VRKAGKLGLWLHDSNMTLSIKTDHQSSNPAAQFSPDGKYFYLASQNAVDVYDCVSCNPVVSLSAKRLVGPVPDSVDVLWAPNSRAIVVLGDRYTGSVEIIDIPPTKGQ
jgi:hypothetical protein